MTTATKKAKKPRLQLSGQDGNVFFIYARAHQAATEAGQSEEWWQKVYAECGGAENYDGVLRVLMKHFKVS